MHIFLFHRLITMFYINYTLGYIIIRGLRNWIAMEVVSILFSYLT